MTGAATSLVGTVVSFDEHAGLGAIEVSPGRRYSFHCTQIADGSRTVPVGTSVRFVVVAGHLGAWEAAGVEQL